MSDAQPSSVTVGTQTPAAATPAPPPAPEPAGEPPAAEPAAEPAGDDLLAGMTVEQIDELAARIEQSRKNRPPSLSETIAQLQQQLTDTHRTKEGAVDERKQAAARADESEATISEIKRTLRRIELLEAATAAGFKQPAIVADALSHADGDAAELVTQAAASGAWAMATPAPSAQIGGPSSKTPPGVDPGMAALADEIAKAHGR